MDEENSFGESSDLKDDSFGFDAGDSPSGLESFLMPNSSHFDLEDAGKGDFEKDEVVEKKNDEEKPQDEVLATTDQSLKAEDDKKAMENLRILLNPKKEGKKKIYDQRGKENTSDNPVSKRKIVPGRTEIEEPFVNDTPTKTEEKEERVEEMKEKEKERRSSKRNLLLIAGAVLVTSAILIYFRLKK